MIREKYYVKVDWYVIGPVSWTWFWPLKYWGWSFRHNLVIWLIEIGPLVIEWLRAKELRG